MKILILTPYFPFPIDSGGNDAQFYILDKLRHKVDITLACPYANNENYLVLKSMWPNVDLQVMYLHKDNRSKLFKKYKAYKKQIKNLIIKFINIVKLKRTIYSTNIKFPDRAKMQYTSLFQNFSLNQEFISFISRVLNNQKIDLIQVEFTSFISLGVLLPNNIKKIFIHHEIAFIRTEREFETLNDKNKSDEFLSDFLKEHEKFYLKAYNSIFTFSNEDRNFLLKELPNSKIHVSPFAIKSNPNTKIEFSEFKNLVYLGGESHYPNFDAILYFANEILPNLLKLYPDLKLKIIGNWNKNTIESFKNNKSIEFLGFVEHLNDAMKDCIMIIPLRIGSGIRAKIIQAFINGIPVISSKIGVEGIPAINNKHFFEANNLDDYIRIIGNLKKNRALAHEIITNSNSEIVPLYDVDVCAKRRYDVYLEILKN